MSLESLPAPRRGGLVLCGVLLTSSAYFLSTGLTGFRPLVWVAPVPVLLLAFNSSVRSAATMACAAYFLGSLNLLPYLASLAPIAVVIIALALPAVAFAISVLAARYVLLRCRAWPAVFVFPAAWVTWEYLLATLSPHGTFGNLAYTQTDFLALMQVASLTGVWGVSFLLTLIPASLAVAWQLRARGRQSAFALVITGVLFATVLGWGWLRLTRTEAGAALTVGLAATDTTIRYFDTDQARDALPVVEDYARRIGALAARGATVVVLPEKFVGVAPDYAGEVYRLLGAAARDNHVTVVAGLNRTGRGPQRNMAVIFAPTGKVLAEYDKTHLLPGFEAQYKPGAETVVVPIAGASAGVAICKDMDFPQPAAPYGQAGVGVLLVPAWDFVRDGRLHGRMALVRGIESGFAVARSAQQGLLTISDPKGRIIVEDSSTRLPETLLVGAVQPGPGRTLYSRAGDWFAWLNLLLLTLIMLAASLRSSRTNELR
ncbi:MAG: apolipoprotein N-acyltransferase [Pyrinomonadaceae bacterium]